MSPKYLQGAAVQFASKWRQDVMLTLTCMACQRTCYWKFPYPSELTWTRSCLGGYSRYSDWKHDVSIAIWREIALLWELCSSSSFFLVWVHGHGRFPLQRHWAEFFPSANLRGAYLHKEKAHVCIVVTRKNWWNSSEIRNADVSIDTAWMLCAWKPNSAVPEGRRSRFIHSGRPRPWSEGGEKRLQLNSLKKLHHIYYITLTFPWPRMENVMTSRKDKMENLNGQPQ